MIKTNRFYYILALLLIAGAFIRFYRLYDYAAFLGDQGRDSIIVKRIVSLEHFPAIGAPSSISTPAGYVYLGPFYYYLVAPFHLISHNPVALAAGVALINTLSIVIVYFAAASLAGPYTGIITATLIAFSQVNVFLSRFSWNPNVLPFFSFMSLYFFLRSLMGKNKWDYILLGIFSALALQLHYLYLAVLPGYAAILFYHFYRKRMPVSQIRLYGLSILAFMICSAPLIIFDLRHHFQNITAFISLFTQSHDIGVQSHGFIMAILATVQHLFGYVLRLDMDIALFTVTAFVLVVLFYASLKKTKDSILSSTAIIIGIAVLVISVYQGNKYEHYFTPIYYTFFFFLALMFNAVRHHFPKAVQYFMYGFLCLYILNNLVHLDFLTKEPNKQIEAARTTAEVIAQHISKPNYTLTTLPDQYSDSTYRYFLEIAGKKPIEKDSLEKASELFVVCEAACKPIGDPQWDIAYFAPTKIADVWKHKGVTIYRLIH